MLSLKTCGTCKHFKPWKKYWAEDIVKGDCRKFGYIVMDNLDAEGSACYEPRARGQH
jgi:hypothetical protein